MSTKKYSIKSLEKRLGPMSLGLYIKAFRQSDEYTQADYAKKLGLSRANLCDIEKGRKLVSPERAAKIAKKMKLPEAVLIQLALQDALREAKLNYLVEIKEVS